MDARKAPRHMVQDEVIEHGTPPPVKGPGDHFGHYQIIAHIKSTAFSVLYHVRDTKTNTQCVLKFLSPELRTHHDRARFEREISIHRDMQDGVPPLIDPGPVDGAPCVVMLYLRGQTLKDRLRQRRLAPREALEIAQQIANILDEAHGKNIVHRDLKPDNIFLENTQNGVQVKILDWGIAQRISEASDELHRTQTLGGGAEHYQPLDAHALHSKNDVATLGAVIIEMLTGSLPELRKWQGKPLTLDSPPFNHRGFDDISSELTQVLWRCIALNRDQRLSAGELSHELSLAIEQMSRGYRSQPSRRLRWGMIGASGFLAISVLSTLVWLRLRADASRESTVLPTPAVLPPPTTPEPPENNPTTPEPPVLEKLPPPRLPLTWRMVFDSEIKVELTNRRALAFTRVWGSGSGQIYAVGNAPTNSTNHQGVILVSEDHGNSFAQLQPPILNGRTLYAVHGQPGVGAVYFGADRGQILIRRKGNPEWQGVQLETSDRVIGLWEHGGELFAIAENTSLLFRIFGPDSTSIEKIPLPPDATALRSLWAGSKAVWIIGDKGLVYQVDRAQKKAEDLRERVASRVEDSLQDVWGTDQEQGSIHIVAETLGTPPKGVLFSSRDGGQHFTRHPQDSAYYGVTGVPLPGRPTVEVVAVGKTKQILRYALDSKAPVLKRLSNNYSFRSVWGADSQHLIAVDEFGQILAYGY